MTKLIDLNNEKQYITTLKNIKERIKHSQINAYRKVNTELIYLYFELWKIISDRQENFWWWKSIVDNLSKDLKHEFGERSWYSVQNLWYMKKFYDSYKENIKLQQLVGEIPWGQNIVILDKCKTIQEKEFYIKLTIEKGLSRNVLIHQIEWWAYNSSKNLKQNNFDISIPKNSDLLENITKDNYLLNFLWLSDKFKERDLENSITQNIKKFLLELWNDFCFIWNQYKISLQEQDYYIDLLFYNRSLKCLFAIELKIEEFKPEFMWKMNFYLELLDEKVKKEDENPSVWIILCKKRNKLVIEYALRTATKPIAVATYEITKKLNEKMNSISG